MRLLALFLFALAHSAAAQDVPVGSCERGTASALLSTGTVSAPFQTNGELLRTRRGTQRYLVPARDSVSTAYGAYLWLTGYVQDSLRTATALYSQGDFWPGPLRDAEAPPSDCTAFDRIWTVSRSNLERYYLTGEVTADLAEWPFEAGAPVLDGDGDATNYNLEGGDQPDLLGDVAVWWVMNDAGNEHGIYRNDPEKAPMGVEVRAHAFAFERSPFPGVSDPALREASFLRLEISNRRQVPLDSLRLSLYVDLDLGSGVDDLVGTDTLRHTAYVYNGDNEDTGPRGYGVAPPAWGVQILRGPVGLPNGRDDDYDGQIDEPGERVRLTTAPVIDDDYGTRYPNDPHEFVNVQRGRTVYGAQLASVGSSVPCYEGICDQYPPSAFAYPADPAQRAFWSEMNADGEGRTNYYGARYLVVSTGASSLEPNESASFLFAFPFARGADHLDSVTALRAVSGGLLASFGDGFPSRSVPRTEPPPPSRYTLTRVRPNPTSRSAEAILDLPEDAVLEAAVYDVLGRRVAIAASGTRPRGRTVIPIPEGLAPGAYMLRVEVDRARVGAVPFTVVR